jgi:hypothetical protein
VFTVPSNRLFLKAALTGKVTGDVMMAMMVMDSNGLQFHIRQDFSILMVEWQVFFSKECAEHTGSPFLW